MANQRQRITKALSLIRPVVSSVRERRPRGFSAHQADAVAFQLASAQRSLEAALVIYEDVDLCRQLVPAEARPERENFHAD